MVDSPVFQSPSDTMPEPLAPADTVTPDNAGVSPSPVGDDRADYEAWVAARKATPANADDYEYIRLPDGTVDRVRKSDIKGAAATAAVDAPDVYVHLANGTVHRVKGTDATGYVSAGTNAPFGYHTDDDGTVHHVVGVYPVESKPAKEGK